MSPLFGVAILFLLLSIYLWIKSVSLNLTESDAKNTFDQPAKALSSKRKRVDEKLREFITVAGFSASISVIRVLVSLSIIVLFLLLVLGHALLTLLLLACFFVVYAFLKSRVRNINKRINDDLVLFLEDFRSDIGSGSSVEVSFRRCTAKTRIPLKDILERINDKRSNGIEIDVSLMDEGESRNLSSLKMFALLLRINKQHGGAISPPLNGLINYLRQLDISKKELHAMTGETRVTAFVLGSLPLLVLMGMLMSSKEFVMTMLDSQSGILALITALVLQILGIFFIVRMLRSVGN